MKDTVQIVNSYGNIMFEGSYSEYKDFIKEHPYYNAYEAKLVCRGVNVDTYN